MQSGQYGGIGSMIQQRDEYIIISNPIEGFPAEKAGLKAGDKILEIDGKSVVGKKADEVSSLLKGAKNTELEVTVKRQNTEEPITIKVTRELIKVPTVPYSEMLNEEVGYIKLTQFLGTSSSEVANAFRTLKDSNNLKGLVLDLRGNPGGLLGEAVNIVNLFVPKGTKVVETKGRDKRNNYTYIAKNKPMDTKIPLVVLLDENSASASEVVSGALQDLDRAVVVGKQSFGKGLVQQQLNMEYNSMIKITIAKYYTPSGRCIQKLDYSDRNKSGKGSSISDSLVTKFKTKNGREVTDGRGVLPDVEVDSKPYTPISVALLTENIIFDFATNYYYDNVNISEASDFKLSESQYEEFVRFAEGKNFEYTTSSEKYLERLMEIAEREKYLEFSNEEFEKLKTKLSPDKKRDLAKFKDEIKLLLENEIVNRYYFQNGQLEHNLNNDEVIEKALATIKDKAAYSAILNPID